MRFALFCHSLRSDWNHENAHFLRGVTRELGALGHAVAVYEPRDAWSAVNLVREHGPGALARFQEAYPELGSVVYDVEDLDLEEALSRVDVAIVDEWSPPEIVAAVGAIRSRRSDFRALFHDTRHRGVTDPGALEELPLRGYDAVMASGRIARDRYLEHGWARRAFVWNQAADTRVFRPRPGVRPEWDLVWIGDLDDDERTEELDEFLVGPVRELGLRAVAYGVRYPAGVLERLAAAGIQYRGWLPDHEVPAVFTAARTTIHVPRKAHAASLAGAPTIRLFEAHACAVPLVSVPGQDAEHLFEAGRDHLVAADGAEMKRRLGELLSDRKHAVSLGACGRRALLARHTCAHRARELVAILGQVAVGPIDAQGEACMG